jgi:hypothetical protein
VDFKSTECSSLVFLDDRVPDDTAKSLFEILRGLLQQWKNIGLGGDPDLLSSLPVDGKYPLLQKLTISYPPLDHVVLSFRDAPKLRETIILEYTPKIQLPWHRLTMFGAESIAIKPCLELLRDASNLAEAYLRILPYVPSALPDTILSLPQLHSLNLGGTSICLSMNPMMPMDFAQIFENPCFEDSGPWLRGCAEQSPRRCVLVPVLMSQSAFQLHTLT